MIVSILLKGRAQFTRCWYGMCAYVSNWFRSVTVLFGLLPLFHPAHVAESLLWTCGPLTPRSVLRWFVISILNTTCFSGTLSTEIALGVFQKGSKGRKRDEEALLANVSVCQSSFFWFSFISNMLSSSLCAASKVSCPTASPSSSLRLYTSPSRRPPR